MISSFCNLPKDQWGEKIASKVSFTLHTTPLHSLLVLCILSSQWTFHRAHIIIIGRIPRQQPTWEEDDARIHQISKITCQLWHWGSRTPSKLAKWFQTLVAKSLLKRIWLINSCYGDALQWHFDTINMPNFTKMSSTGKACFWTCQHTKNIFLGINLCQSHFFHNQTSPWVVVRFQADFLEKLPFRFGCQIRIWLSLVIWPNHERILATISSGTLSWCLWIS